MRSFFIFLLIAASTAAASPKPSLSDDGWDVAQQQGYTGGTYFSNLGTTYGPANQPPSDDQAVAMIQSQLPGSTSEIAAQQSNLVSPPMPCSQSATNQIQALSAQVQTLDADIETAYRNEVSCGTNYTCVTYWAGQALSYGQQAAVIGNQVLALAPAAQQEALCSESGAQQTSVVPGSLPAGMTLAALAARFKVTLASGMEGNLGSAYQQLLDAAQGYQQADADFDGSGAGFGQDVRDYAGDAAETDAMGAEINAGEAASQQTPDYDDPDSAAKIEALTIDYRELGPKYAALVNARSEAADEVADAAVDSDQPVAFLGSGAPEVQIQTSNADDEADAAVPSGWSRFEAAALSNVAGNAGPAGTALAGVVNIGATAVGGVSNMLNSLAQGDFDAAAQQAQNTLDTTGQTSATQEENMERSLVGAVARAGVGAAARIGITGGLGNGQE